MSTSAKVTICTILTFTVLGHLARMCAAELTADQSEFRRQAVRRMIFSKAQDIPSAGLWPARVVGLDVMHPPVGEQKGSPRLGVGEGRLRIDSEKDATVTHWVGGFNPFAAYDLAVSMFNGSGEVGVMFRDTDAANRIVATLVVDNGKYRAIRWVVVK